MAVDTGFLKSTPYFAGLSQSELESIQRSVFERTAARDEMILLEGEPPDALYFVVSGVIKVFKSSPEGKEQTIRIVRPGQSFNDVSVFDGGPNPASAQAMGPALICGIRRSDLETVLKANPQVALNVNRELARRLRELMTLVEDLSFRHVTDRIAKILLENSTNGDRAPRLTQREMAAMAGTARELVGRSLKALEQARAIKMDRHRIIITDSNALRRMAGMAQDTEGRSNQRTSGDDAAKGKGQP